MNYKYDINNDGYNDYGFAGWSEDKNVASKILDTDPDNNSTIYGPNQTITLGDVSAYGFKLYAVCMPIAKYNTNTDLTFQTTNLLATTLADGSTLASKPNGYITALKDQRDNQVYAVAKLADGNYWMIENLRLDNNPDQPNWGNNALSQGFGGEFVGLANAETENFTNSTAANSLYHTGNSTTMPRYNNTNTISPVANMTTYDDTVNVYSSGNYYTWAAAVADTTAYASMGENADVATSICPAGWRLPLGGEIGANGSFSHLDSAMGGTGGHQGTTEASNKWRSFPNNFVYSGYWDGSSGYLRGVNGGYWSSTTDSTFSSYNLSLYSLGVTPGMHGNHKYTGGTVRCVAPI